MKIAIGADHAGFSLKGVLIKFLREEGHDVLDTGAFGPEPSDYPDIARAVAETVLRGEAERGILICGSGVGASIVANKLPGIRAAVCHDTYSARQGVEHDDLNVLCLGERVIGPELAKELAVNFLSVRFSGIERHARRLEKIGVIERDYMKAEAALHGKRLR